MRDTPFQARFFSTSGLAYVHLGAFNLAAGWLWGFDSASFLLDAYPARLACHFTSIGRTYLARFLLFFFFFFLSCILLATGVQALPDGK
jgi:hypothetical protein